VLRFSAPQVQFIASRSRDDVALPRVHPIDSPPLTAKDRTMNTTSILHRAVSFSFAAIVTVMTLAGVDALATQQPSPALMAHVATSAQA
jgi:hypothetical protein